MESSDVEMAWPKSPPLSKNYIANTINSQLFRNQWITYLKYRMVFLFCPVGAIIGESTDLFTINSHIFLILRLDTKIQRAATLVLDRVGKVHFAQNYGHGPNFNKV